MSIHFLVLPVAEEKKMFYLTHSRVNFSLSLERKTTAAMPTN